MQFLIFTAPKFKQNEPHTFGWSVGHEEAQAPEIHSLLTEFAVQSVSDSQEVLFPQYLGSVFGSTHLSSQ